MSVLANLAIPRQVCSLDLMWSILHSTDPSTRWVAPEQYLTVSPLTKTLLCHWWCPWGATCQRILHEPLHCWGWCKAQGMAGELAPGFVITFPGRSTHPGPLDILKNPFSSLNSCLTSLSFCPTWLKLINWFSSYLMEGTEKEEQRKAAQTHRSHFAWKQDKKTSPANFKVKTQRCKKWESAKELF